MALQAPLAFLSVNDDVRLVYPKSNGSNLTMALDCDDLRFNGGWQVVVTGVLPFCKVGTAWPQADPPNLGM